jgi:hypothetical protein
MPVSQKAHFSNHVQARFAVRVVFKSLVLFLIINLGFGLVDPVPFLGQHSIYNHLIPGRQRLPYGDNPSRAYSLSLYQLDAMFASHLLAAGPKPVDEFRIILIGDSSTWGYLLHPDETLSAHLNRAGLQMPDGRTVRVYNLGYPVMSLMKDLLILSRAGQYQPDLVVWLLTLESFPYDKQLFAPLLQHNPQPVRSLIQNYQLNLNSNDPGFVNPGFWDRTLLGQRRTLADLLRLQLYGVLWAATGIDQDIPANFLPRMEDLPADQNFHNLQPPHLEQADLAFEILEAGVQSAGQTPVLIVNEPVFISRGENSAIRYNFYYPRWAYDDYRVLLAERSVQEGWHYLDLWNVIAGNEFTNSAVHLSPAGSAELAGLIASAILEGPWAIP